MRARFLMLMLCISVSSACSSVRHNNLMLFADDTNFGISAGTTAGNVPQVVVGYRRIEAVAMPLSANVSAQTGSGDKGLVPCDPSKPDAFEKCKFVAEYGGKARDSYSVLASFGAQFNARGADPNAGGGLAQYFATGVAAQILALKGGAALVSTGTAAVESSKTNVASELATLIGSPDTAAEAIKISELRKTKRDELARKMLQKNDEALGVYLRDLSSKAFGGNRGSTFITDACNRSRKPLRDCAIAFQTPGNIVTDDLIDILYKADQAMSSPSTGGNQ